MISAFGVEHGEIEKRAAAQKLLRELKVTSGNKHGQAVTPKVSGSGKGGRLRRVQM